MLSEAVKRAPDDLGGLPLAEAFHRHVIQDDEIAEIGRRIMQVQRGNSDVFLEGQFPGAFVNFHWPLHISAADIAYAFVSSPVTFLDRPLPTPSELESAASKLIADRFAALVNYLAQGQLIAVGTFNATGVEGPIGTGQWRRADLVIDVKNSAICEMKDHRPVALWTGVCLQLHDQHPSNEQFVVSLPNAEEPTRARKQIQTKENSRRQCVDWLGAMMSDPSVSPLTNTQLWRDAKSKWPKTLSKREFDRCRATVLSSLSEKQRYLWGRPGPRRKQS
ncbi:hypothetical protein IVB55_32770 [Bradyrhizobium sp. CW4]|uniref:hypothetical protein n=1 Tax=Bradyrhizobium sp. CW4 TaxID=2782687 RepID=UPI001FFA9998|nr:hypothetical protein [Bradyrhizobium sp. CW4]MCK1417632.1 hypothetical protein [Bradyrhizobium sp. CW4]